jgi:menaquinone-dependent protoporphyrinogen oxidase
MSKVLVTYATMAGSTAEVALAVGEEIIHYGKDVDILPLEKVSDLSPYESVVIGAPMIMGWHRSALKFVAKNRKALSQVPLAVFVLAMSLTATGETEVNGVPVCIDEELTKPPQKLGHLTVVEHHTSITGYATPIIKAAAPSRPVSIAFFGGRVEYFRLNPFARLFVKLVIQARPGDRRNWKTIRSWAHSLPALLNSSI